MIKTIVKCSVCQKEFDTTFPNQKYCDDICRSQKPKVIDKEKMIADRKHRSLTTQQITYLTARINGKSKEEAKRMAKYSPTTSTTLIESNPNMKAALLTCMQANGLNEQFLVDKLMQGM